MIKIDIISGFLGAGKTTLIKRLLNTNIKNEKVILVENEFGEIGIDAGFLKEAQIDIKEINQGCICCSLKGDFSKALKEVVDTYSPERIIIEPSGVGKLSDILTAVHSVGIEDLKINALVCVCDTMKIKMYLRNFGEFYIDQIKNANTIFLSRTDVASQQKIDDCITLIKEVNEDAIIVTTNIGQLSDEILLESYNGHTHNMEEELLEEVKHDHEHEHHHHEGCTCGHHHDHEHEHHHHEGCTCGHHHDHDHDHNAEEVFTSLSIETSKKYTKEELEHILDELYESDEFGVVLRAKGIVEGKGCWYYFDMVPGEIEIRTGEASISGKICVIGSKLNNSKIKELFLK